MPQNDDEPKFTFSHQSADIYVCVCVCVLCVRACVRVGGGREHACPPRIVHGKEISDIKCFVLQFFLQISLTWKTFLRMYFKSCKNFYFFLDSPMHIEVLNISLKLRMLYFLTRYPFLWDVMLYY